MDLSDNYPKGRNACFDIGISGNCIGNCLLCRAFEEDFNGQLSKLDKINNNAMELVQELIDKGYIDLYSIKEDYLMNKNLSNKTH